MTRTDPIDMDQGTRFGTWGDPTSDLMYRGAMPYLLRGLPIGCTVYDLGGANGLSRMFLPDGARVLTVDSDPTKSPDVVADILDWRPHNPDPRATVLLRYVLHYLDDGQLSQLMNHLASWHRGNTLLIQFFNEDTRAKIANSPDADTKTFRSWLQTLPLLWPWGPTRGQLVNSLDYDVTPDFYANRAGTPGRFTHRETLIGASLTKGA